MFAQQPAHYWPPLPGVWKGLIKFLSKAQHSGGGSAFRRRLKVGGLQSIYFSESLKASPWGKTSRHRWWRVTVTGKWSDCLSIGLPHTCQLWAGKSCCFSFSFIKKNCQCSPEISFPFSRLPKTLWRLQPLLLPPPFSHRNDGCPTLTVLSPSSPLSPLSSLLLGIYTHLWNTFPPRDPLANIFCPVLSPSSWNEVGPCGAPGHRGFSALLPCCFLSIGNRLQPPWPSMNPKGRFKELLLIREGTGCWDKGGAAKKQYCSLGTRSWFHLQFSSVQSLSRVWLFATPWTAARQASLSINQLHLKGYT